MYTLANAGVFLFWEVKMSEGKRGPYTPQGITESRIQYVEDLMRTFKFRRGRTARELAKEWNIPLTAVHHVTKEASKRIAKAIMDPETVNAKVCTALEEIIDRCLETGKYREAVQAAKAWSYISGSAAPSRHEITGKDGAPICGPMIFIPPEDGSGSKGQAMIVNQPQDNVAELVENCEYEDSEFGSDD